MYQVSKKLKLNTPLNSSNNVWQSIFLWPLFLASNTTGNFDTNTVDKKGDEITLRPNK